MINSIEIKVNDFLQRKTGVERLNNELIYTYRLPETLPLEKETILNFFLNSGQKKTAFRLILHDVKNEKPVFWGHLITIVFSASDPPSESLKEAMHNGIVTQNGDEKAAQSRFVQLLSENLGRVRQIIRKQLQEDYQKAKELLFQKLEFYRNEELYDDERKVLEQIEFLYPRDPRIEDLKEDFSQRWARELITQKSSRKIDNPMILPEPKELIQEGNFLYEYLSDNVKWNLTNTYDFSLFFYNVGQHQNALKVLNKGPSSFATNWFKVEILFGLRRFVECLDELEILDEQYGQLPDTAFATAYYRAQCYWELRQPRLAVEVMQRLLQIKPEYRSADSFLAKWMQGEQIL